MARIFITGSADGLGRASAQTLLEAGHDVVVLERADRIGGLLRYGIPEFKMEKRHIDRRLEQMAAEGTQFRACVNVGVDITAEELRAQFDAVVRAANTTVSIRQWSSCRGRTGCSRATRCSATTASRRSPPRARR